MCCWSELKNVGYAFKWIFLSCSVSNYVEAFLKLLRLAQIFWIHRGPQNFNLHTYAILVWTISQQKISFLLFKFWPNEKKLFCIFDNAISFCQLASMIRSVICNSNVDNTARFEWKLFRLWRKLWNPNIFFGATFLWLSSVFCAAYRECIC